MLRECLDFLEPAANRPEAIVVDATLGLGGHTEALLRAHPSLTVVGLDRDHMALEQSQARLESFGSRFQPVHAVFSDLSVVLDRLGIAEIDGALFDLGVSSMQLDEAARGFAYAQDAPLDMRMDQAQGETAAELLARLDESELGAIFRRYGDEPLAGRYAAAIVRARNAQPITRSEQLVEILQAATPAAISRKRHPAKRVFQSLRIVVNGELEAIETAIPAALDRLAVGGRVVVMAYQSLEDRIVKHEFSARTQSLAPRGLPVELPEHRARFALLTRGAMRASEEEQSRNPRSIPARLRAIERTREAA